MLFAVLSYCQLMRKNIKYILALVLIGSACGGGGSDFSGDYPTEVKDNFIQACLAEGGGRETCECALGAITQRLEYPVFVRIDEAAQIGLPRPFESFPEVEAAIEECL